MSNNTSIEWTDRTWNPVRGCSRVSPGCVNCYAEGIAARFSKPGLAYEGLAKRVGGEARWTGQVRLIRDALTEPLSWRKPQRIFVNSMSDLFHEALTNEQIALVFGAMAAAPQHTFQVLTKRADRMREWFKWAEEYEPDEGGIGPHRAMYDAICHDGENSWPESWDSDGPLPLGDSWPLKNVWLGVSVEDQVRAGERIAELVRTPAAVRFLSCEPLLEHIALGLLGTMPKDWGMGYAPICSRLNWVIIGGESGRNARPFDVQWARSIVKECADADVACFVKQLGAVPFDGTQSQPKPTGAFRTNPSTLKRQAQFTLTTLGLDSAKGGDPREWPADLRVRQFPEVRGV